MPTGKATKASDKSMICKKVVTALQKIYGKSLPKLDQPALETIMFAICLEDNSWADAEAAYKRLLEEYFDLNEIRVTSVSELEQTLQPLRFGCPPHHRIYGALQLLVGRCVDARLDGCTERSKALLQLSTQHLSQGE